MKAIYSGHIEIGLLRVPVSAFKAREGYVSPFNLVSNCCNERIKMPKTCGACEKVCGTKRAFNVGTKKSPEYVIFEEGELGNLETGNIEIQSVGANNISAERLGEPYYLTPYGKKAKNDALKLYSLLHKQLSDDKTILLGSVVMRSKQKPCAIIPDKEGLVLWLLHWKEDIRPRPKIESVILLDEEITKMSAAMKALTAGLKPAKEVLEAKDEYREKLMDAVRAKMTGQAIKPVVASVSDGLLDQLDKITKPEAENGAL